MQETDVFLSEHMCIVPFLHPSCMLTHSLTPNFVILMGDTDI